MNTKKIAFFGTPEFAVWTLESMKEKGLVPNIIITTPDAPKGRKLILTPPPVKIWAEKNNIPVLQPKSVKNEEFIREIESVLGIKPDLFIVAAYGKILPKALIETPVYGTINVHPSLLPLLRGASPIESAILADMHDTGVTIIRIDEELDHGPLLAQEESLLPVWPIDTDALGMNLAHLGGDLIMRILTSLFSDTLKETPQDHSKATFTKKIKKEDGLMDISADGYQNFLKWNAHHGWPGSYFFIEKGGKKIRISIKDADYRDGEFVVNKVVPEGKKEMTFAEFKSWEKS